MTAVVPTGRVATLPNCTRCGRFTSTPTVRQWCTESGASMYQPSIRLCFEDLLCPRCAAKGDQP